MTSCTTITLSKSDTQENDNIIQKRHTSQINDSVFFNKRVNYICITNQILCLELGIHLSEKCFSTGYIQYKYNFSKIQILKTNYFCFVKVKLKSQSCLAKSMSLARELGSALLESTKYSPLTPLSSGCNATQHCVAAP